MSGFSIRSRAVVAAAVSILLAVVLLGVGVDVLVGRHLRESLDASLRRRAVAVAQLSATTPALLTAPGALESPLGGTDTSVEVLDRRGRLVARTLGLGGRMLPARALAADVIASGRPAFADGSQPEGSIRMYAAPLAALPGSASGGAVVVAASTADLEDTLRALHLGVILSALAATLLGAAAVAVLLGRAFRPLGRLATAAAEIERTGDSHARLPEPPVTDEVGRLAGTLNAMLESLERAREAERRFVADASHELRTPLTALRGNIDFLARHGATGQVVAELEHDAERLARLADDLIVVSREDAAGRPGETVALEDVADAVAAGDPRVEVEVEHGPVLVVGDREALERAVSNLVRNAQVHGPAGGAIAITIAVRNGLARLTVADEGRGIAAGDELHAFERFWRGAHDRAGSGLGLAIVRSTAERHGGRAYAEGSRFTIELPALREISEVGAISKVEPTEEGRS
jgi:two-component system OmpR family sensor kinase